MYGTIQGDLYVPSSISTIRNYLNKQGGPATANRYKVVIHPPDGLNKSQFDTESLTIMCEMASLPGIGFETASIPDIGPDYVYPFEATFEDFELAFICSENMQERKFFNNWFLLIHPINDGNFPLYEFRKNYTTNMTVTKYDKAGNITYKIQVVEAFPITMPDQEIGYDNDETLKLNVTFNYSRWVVMHNTEDDKLIKDNEII